MLTPEQTRFRYQDTEMRELKRENERLTAKVVSIQLALKEMILEFAKRTSGSEKSTLLMLASQLD